MAHGLGACSPSYLHLFPDTQLRGMRKFLPKRFQSSRRQDVAAADVELRPITTTHLSLNNGQEMDGQTPSHGGNVPDADSLRSPQSLFDRGVSGTTDLPAWQDCPPSPTTKSAIDSSPHSYSHQEARDVVNEHPSFQRAQILSTEIYMHNEGAIAYNFLVIDLTVGTTRFYLSVDGRKIGREYESDPFDVSSNVVHLSADRAKLALGGLTKLNRQRFNDPPTMYDLVRLLEVVHEGANNTYSRLCCSLIQQHLGNRYRGSFEQGDNILPNLRHGPARTMDENLGKVAYFQPPIPPLSDLLYSMAGEPDKTDPKYEAFELSLELDVSRNFQDIGRRALATKLGNVLHDLAMQAPVAEHPNVSYIWEHSVILFRAINRYDEVHRADLARSLYHYGCSLRDGGQSENAITILREAVHIYEYLDNAAPNTYRSFLALASTAYSESLNVSRPLLSTQPPKLIVSIAIGSQYSSVAVGFWEAGKQVLRESVVFWPGQGGEPQVPSVVMYASGGRIVCGRLENAPREDQNDRPQRRFRRAASRAPPSRLYSDYLNFLISHTRSYLSIRARKDVWPLFEKHGEIVLSHADAERDEMHSFLLQTMTSVGLNRALILDKAQTVASITLLSNEHVTPTVIDILMGKVGSTVLVCDGGPSIVEFTAYSVADLAGARAILQRVRPSVSNLKGGVEMVNSSFELYFRTNMTWEGFSQNDIDSWFPVAAEHFDQHGRRSFSMAAASCEVNLQSRRLDNVRLRIRKGVMNIERNQAAKFFEPLIQGLISAIQPGLGRQTSIIILQGGLSEMPYIMENLQTRFDSTTADAQCINGTLSNVGDITLGTLDILVDGEPPTMRPILHSATPRVKRKWPLSRGRSSIRCDITEI